MVLSMRLPPADPPICARRLPRARAAGLLAGLLAAAPAAAAPLRLDPAAPPTALGGGVWRFGPAGAPALEVLPGVVLHLAPGVAPPAGARPLGGRSHRLPAESPEAAVALSLRLSQEPGVTAFPDVRLPKRRAWDDPGREGQWYLDLLDMEPLYAISTGSADVRVAVIDSGIDVAHEDLAAGVLAPYDACDDDDDPSPNPGEYCGGGGGVCDEHGTAVSGVVAARGDNGAGIVGLCPGCTLVPIKLLGEGCDALSADLAAFEHAIAQDVAVINNSWGYVRPVDVPAPLAEVIGRAATEPRGGKGALVVFAAGNDDREVGDAELQALPDVLCVTATDAYGRYTNYTNFGDPVDVAAPSATVTLAPNDGTTTTFGGTSAAAPVVSGLAGWALSVDPSLTAAELRALFVETAVPSPLVTHDEQGHHPYYGYGNISPAALLAALTGAPADSGGPGAGAGGADGAGADPADGGGKGGCAVAPARTGGLAYGLPILGGALILRRRRR